MVPDGRTDGRNGRTDGRTDDAKTISLRLRRGITNKGTDKQYVVVLLLHNTNNHYQALYQISES